MQTCYAIVSFQNYSFSSKGSISNWCWRWAKRTVHGLWPMKQSIWIPCTWGKTPCPDPPSYFYTIHAILSGRYAYNNWFFFLFSQKFKEKNKGFTILQNAVSFLFSCLCFLAVEPFTYHAMKLLRKEIHFNDISKVKVNCTDLMHLIHSTINSSFPQV